MAEQKAGLDRELWARIGEIADAYSKKEMAADIAAAAAWAADRKRIEALEKPPRPSDLSDAVNLVQRAMTCIEAVPDGLWPAWDKELSEAFNCLDDAVGTPARCLEEAALVAKEDK